MYITEVISFTPDKSVKICADNSSSIIAKTIESLKKDFEKYGYFIKYSGNPDDAYEQIVVQVRNIVDEIISESHNKLLEIFSAIGLSEKKVKDTLSTNPQVSPSKIISRLIIESEFKKVCDCASYGAE